MAISYGARRIATNISNFGPKVPLERRSCDECYPTPPFGAKFGPQLRHNPQGDGHGSKKVWFFISLKHHIQEFLISMTFLYIYIFKDCVSECLA